MKKIYLGAAILVLALTAAGCAATVEPPAAPVKEVTAAKQDAEIGSRDAAIEKYLLSQNQFAWQTQGGSQNFCVFENVSGADALFPLALWVRCGEFVAAAGDVEEASGTSVPIMLNYPNELSYFDPAKFTFETPRDGSYNGPDFERIFPAALRQKLSSLDKAVLNAALRQKARRNLIAE